MSTATVTRQSILEELGSGKITPAMANAELVLLDKSKGRLSFKVSAKGACSVYGLGRWPITLYVGQWESLIAVLDQLKAFLVEHNSELSRKS